MRISDWSSDVCSSDLFAREHPVVVFGAGFALAFGLARFLKSGRADEAADEVDRSDDGGDTESSTAYESAAAGSLSGGNPTSPAGMPSSQPLPSMGAPPPEIGSPSRRESVWQYVKISVVTGA